MTENPDTVHDISSLPKDRTKAKKKIVTMGVIAIAAFASFLIIDDYLKARSEDAETVNDEPKFDKTTHHIHPSE